MGTAVPVASFWYTEAPHKVSPHSESGGRTWPAPPPKAIAHPFFGHFWGGRTWGRDLRALIFGRGSAHGLFLAYGGPSQSLAPSQVLRTNLAIPNPQGYSPPVFWAFFRWGVLAPRPSRADFWVQLFPWPIFGTWRPPAKYGAIPSPADADAPHQRYSPHVFWPFFRWGVLAPRPSGAYFLARLIFGTPRPLAKSRPIPSPADELRPRPPPRL